jgi:subtilisin family serine protease
MKRSLFPIALALSVAAPLAAADARYAVVMRAPLHRSHIRMLNEAAEGQQHDVRTLNTIDAFAATLSEDEVATLRASAEVRSVDRVVERHINDENGGQAPSPVLSATSPFTHQIVPYGIDMIHAQQAWPVTRGDNVNLVVIDTGIDTKHPDLVRAYAGGFNTYSPGDPPLDDERHGTHVAGTIAATDNNIGVVGVAPDVRLWSVKVLDRTGFGDDEHIAAGTDWVIAKKRASGGNWIVSMSLGGKDDSNIERAAIARAVAEGIMIVAAAGNRGLENLDFPASYDGVMAIGAIDSAKEVASFSNRAAGLSVVGPGVSVISTVPTGTATVADVSSSTGVLLDALPLRGTPRGDANGSFVFCNLGAPEDFPANVAGKIAVIRRGVLTFNDKARNAKAAGATAVVILNAEDKIEDVANWTLILQECSPAGCHDSPDDVSFAWPLTIGMTFPEGEKLLALLNKATIAASYRSDDYARFTGTSMATPHVSATAALLWSINPNLRPDQIRQAIEDSAEDLGAPGFDPKYGHGLVDALAAAKRIAPDKFGLPPIITPPRRHGSGH